MPLPLPFGSAARIRTIAAPAPSLALAISISLSALLQACASTPTSEGRAAGGTSIAADASTPLPAGTHTLVVRGMSCPKCVTNVDKQLARLAGVERATVDMKHGTVAIVVAGDRRPTAAQLAAAVEDAGFTLESIDTPSKDGGAR